MKITGLMIYYYFVCKKKLWYFLQGLAIESDNELVKIGKIIDDTSYEMQDKHITIHNTISIDYLKQNREIHEIKKSRSIEEANIMQVKYYLYYLKQYGIQDMNAVIDYPKLREIKKIEIDDKDEEALDKVITEIKIIKNQNIPPAGVDCKICTKCAYYDLCKL